MHPASGSEPYRRQKSSGREELAAGVKGSWGWLVAVSLMPLWLAARAKPSGDVPSGRPLPWSSVLRSSPGEEPPGLMGDVCGGESFCDDRHGRV